MRGWLEKTYEHFRPAEFEVHVSEDLVPGRGLPRCVAIWQRATKTFRIAFECEIWTLDDGRFGLKIFLTSEAANFIPYDDANNILYMNEVADTFEVAVGLLKQVFDGLGVINQPLKPLKLEMPLDRKKLRML